MLIMFVLYIMLLMYKGGDMFKLVFTKVAARSLKRINKGNRKAGRAIGIAIEALTTEPRPHGYKKLTGQPGLYRIRVGQYRVVYTIDDEPPVVHIRIVGVRGDLGWSEG